MTSVPQTTIKDRRLGNVSKDCFNTGAPTVFTAEQEAKLKNHVLEMSSMGYGYTRTELIHLATDMAHFLSKLPQDRTLSEAWLYLGFLKRNRDISLLKPRSLNMSRAKSVTPETVEKYFQNLKDILDKYDLLASPGLIYNIDESGFSPEHTPPKLACQKGQTPNFISSPRSTTVTCIGACNAIGNSIPPFLIFKGKRMLEDLTEGATPGCGFGVSDSGWSNSLLFQNYLKNHFLKFAMRQNDKHLLLLYDGSSTHFSAELVDWALEQKIILFVIPPHSSHLLQPLDVGCFSPLKKCYNSLAHRYMKEHCGQVITRYSMTSLICKAYAMAMTPINIQRSFQKTGIFPFDPNKPIDSNTFKLAEATVPPKAQDDTPDIDEMLSAHLPNRHKQQTPKRVRKNVNTLGGMAITEGKGYYNYCIYFLTYTAC